MDLIRRFSADAYRAALESWTWIGDMAGMQPAFATASGDMFLQDQAGGFSFLDTVSGSLERVWPDAGSLQSDMNTPEVQDRYPMVGLVQAALEAGLTPGEGQVLSFKVPPALAGVLTVENVELADLVVAVNTAGQVHKQIKDLPPGSPISDISVD